MLTEEMFRWIVCSTVLASVLIFLILFIKGVVKGKLSSNWHYLIWILLVLKLLIPFGPKSYTSVFNIIHLTDQKITQKSYDVISNISNTAQVIAVNTPIPYIKNAVKLNDRQLPNSKKPSHYSSIGIVIWFMGALITFILFLKSLFKLQLRLQGGKTLHDQRIIRCLESCKYKMGIYRDIQVVGTQFFKSPAVYGIFRIKLLMPLELLETWNDEQLKYAVMHELAHIKRKDIPIRVLTGFLCIIHWFNPLIWFAFYKMRLDAELACDELILKTLRPIERKNYGLTIIGMIERHSSSLQYPLVANMGGTSSQIKKRILNIAIYKEKPLKFAVISTFITIMMGLSLLTNAIE